MMLRMETPSGQQPPAGARHVHHTLVPALEAADAIVYGLVGIVFLLAALGMLGTAWPPFFADLHNSANAAAILAIAVALYLLARDRPACIRCGHRPRSSAPLLLWCSS